MMKFKLPQKYAWSGLVGLYFLTRIVNLGKLPIFNDEAIYLDWGRVMTTSGQLFFSLFDGKQPFLMWVFGLMMKVFPAWPLVAGRLVSVASGVFSLVGLMLLAKDYFSKKTAIVAGLIYILSPIFLFFDRQALMEGSLMAVGIWSFYLLMKLEANRRGWILGLLVGVWSLGLWVKSSAGIFMVSSLLMVGLLKTNRKGELFAAIVFGLFLSLILLLPLLIQPGFANVITLNSRFALGGNELAKMPIDIWIKNARMTLDTLATQVAGWGLLLWFTKSKNSSKLMQLDWWLAISLAIFVLTTRNPNPRYLVVFLPLICIGLAQRWWEVKRWLKILMGLSWVWLVMLDTALIFEPLAYFRTLAKVSNYSQIGAYTGGFSSGYGVKEAIDYVIRDVGDKKAIVVTRLDAGNPENAVSLYLSRYPNIQVQRWGVRPKEATDRPKYLDLEEPIYFIAREENLAGHNQFFELVKRFDKPDGVNWVGVYKVKNLRDF
ncbi:MAG: hypothetical protein ACD_83C00042G0003 [uncultured bacterium]|nr:MAG: hypothetical protein ACD_83C00042G0003 [uncultured bacterium]